MPTKINLRSPFFIKATPSSGTISKAVLSLFVYKGTFTTDKGSALYTVEKTPLTGNNFVVFEISELARDYLDIEFDGDYESQSGTEIDPVRWVEADIVITKTDSSTENSNTDYVAFDGYGYFEEGVNPELSRTLLQSNKSILRINDFNTRIPVFTEDTNSVSFLYNGETVKTFSIADSSSFPSTNTNAQIKYVNIFDTDDDDNYRQRVLADGGTFEENSLLDSFLNSIDVGVFDTVFINSSSGTEVLTVDKRTIPSSASAGCFTNDFEGNDKFENIKITFVNKFGALQDMFFTFKSVESTNVESRNFKRSIFNESELKYNKHQHQNNLFHVNATDRISLSTGFLNEEYNKVIEELMISEQHWMTRVTDTEEQIIPVMPVTKSVTYRTSANDRLIQYTIEFDMAFNKINNIR
tara:strand:+ start:295 stop:1527 length:1233 start_codon:yes stop_codon:yes gene_type:complete